MLVKGGSWPMTLQPTHGHWRRCDQQQCPAEGSIFLYPYRTQESRFVMICIVWCFCSFSWFPVLFCPVCALFCSVRVSCSSFALICFTFVSLPLPECLRSHLSLCLWCSVMFAPRVAALCLAPSGIKETCDELLLTPA